MHINRPWAFWRRTQYAGGFFVFLMLISTGIYFGFFYKDASCIDGSQNGAERGIDCGGSCTRICAIDVTMPTPLWARAFKVTDGQYNAVAYIENKNMSAGSPEVSYTFKLYDKDGLIAERSGVTIIPPDSVYPIFEGRIDTQGRIPTDTFIELGDTELWYPATGSREQFTVEGRELVGADSSPRLSARIRNNELTEAKNVEIVATIFDTNGNALTASRTIVPRFDSRATEDVVFTWPEPIAKTIRSCELPTDVVLAIDLSGSMNNDGGTPPQPVTSVLRAAEAFIDRLNQNDKIGVVTYATNAVTTAELSSDSKAVRAKIGTLAIDPKEEKGNTNTGDAIIKAMSELSSNRHSRDARKVVVLLTDGLATAPAKEPEKYAIDAALQLKETGTEIFTIGLGASANDVFLKSLASDESHYFKAGSADTVDKIYRSVTDAICEDGAAVIEIVPKTTARFEGL